MNHIKIADRFNNLDSFTLRFWYNELQLVEMSNVEYQQVRGTADGAKKCGPVWGYFSTSSVVQTIALRFQEMSEK
jgi:hypothetical protein